MVVIATRIWIGDSGSWDDTAHWSDAYGNPGVSVPTSSDSVFFNADSFSTTGCTITGTLVVCNSMSWAAIDKSGQIFSFNRANVYGNFYPSSNMSMSGTKEMYFYGSNKRIGDTYLGYSTDFGKVHMIGDSNTIWASNTFQELITSAGESVIFQTGETQTIGTLAAIGTSGLSVYLTSNVSGSPAMISVPSGEVNVDYCYIRGITATGGATFYADNSIDGGDNSGWYFVTNRLSVDDVGSGIDTARVLAGLTVGDTGSGVDAATILAAIAVIADGHEHTQVAAIGIGYTFDPTIDTGSGVDVVTADVVANVFWQDIFETFTGVDGSLTVTGSTTLYQYIADGHQTTQLVVGMGEVFDPSLDTGYGADAASILAGLTVADTGVGADAARVLASLTASDTGHGVDIGSVAKTFWLIDSHNILQPLGVFVMRDGKEELLPTTRNNTDTIPGRHGEFDFGSELEARVMEFKVHINTTPETKTALKRTLAAYLNPLLGVKPLVDSHDMDKTYYVKYAGNIDLTNYVNALQFTIPFKASDPVIYGTFEQTQVGSGTITNDGTLECPMTITIIGAVTNPAVVVGTYTLTYTGTLTSSDTLIIDTGALTCTLNGVNAMGNLTGLTPDVVLVVGDTVVTAASAGSTVFTWTEQWI